MISIEADDEEIGFKMLIRCIDYDQLIGFITNNLKGTLDKENIHLNLDTFNILGFISGSDDSQYLTRMMSGQ